MSPEGPGNYDGLWFWTVLLLTAVVRGAVLMTATDSLVADPDGYRQLAEALVETHCYCLDGKPTAFRPPLYPAVLALSAFMPVDQRFAIALIHFACGVATVALVMRLGRAAGLGRGMPLAGLLVAVDPVLLFWSRYPMTETLAVWLGTVTLVVWHCYAQRPDSQRALFAGLAIGLATLCRPVFLVWGGFACLGVLLLRDSGQGRGASKSVMRSRHACAAAAGLCLLVVPWTVRNYAAIGHPVLATTHGGYTLLLGNNPYFYDYLRSGSFGVMWKPDEFFAELEKQRPPRRTAEDEWRRDRQAYAMASEAIRREPAMFAYASLVRAGRLWSPLPHRRTDDESVTMRAARIAVACWYVAIYVAAILGVWQVWGRWRTSPWLWALGLVIAVTLMHAFYWSNIRMRAPLMPVVALVTAAGIERRRES